MKRTVMLTLVLVQGFVIAGEQENTLVYTVGEEFFEGYHRAVEDARSLALGPEGTVFVGNRKEDKVWAVADTNGDHRADRAVVVAEGLTSPNGVAVREGDLYVAERSRVLKFPDIEARIDNPPEPEVIRDDFPTDPHHGWKYIAFGPDGAILVSDDYSGTIYRIAYTGESGIEKKHDRRGGVEGAPRFDARSAVRETRWFDSAGKRRQEHGRKTGTNGFPRSGLLGNHGGDVAGILTFPAD